MEALESRKEMGVEILEKVEEVISAISKAKHVDQVICALHSIAVLLFPVDSSLVAGLSLVVQEEDRFVSCDSVVC